MSAIREQLAERGVAVVVCSFAEPQKLKRYQEHFQWPFALVADPNRTVYRAMGLGSLSWRQLLAWRSLKLYLRLICKGRKVRGPDGADVHQGGGDFLIDRDGVLLFAHRSEEPADRPTNEQLLAAVAAA